MKIARVRLPRDDGATIGLVDEARSEILDAGQVVRQLGLPVSASTAVELVRYNTENSGALADAVKDLSRFNATRWPIDSLRFLAPIEATSLKDFLAFEVHLSNARKRNNLEIPPAWYELPVYYKGNHRTLGGHDEFVYWPRFSEQMDYELELACIIGKEGIDIPVEHADQYIGGYCIMNDWSARDIQMKEMSVGLGPAKGKDFATSMGPWLVTPDEFDPATARMVARVNGEVWSDGMYSTVHWSFAQMLAHVSMDEAVYPGDVFGSGTVGFGCGLEHGRWLQPGNLVELEITGLGVLRNRLVRVFK
jgi:2-keto-4-pentenoate hydratase/2-oxohepta-3-ene-1,7-dioic acid hydratase in catechol pathway